MMGNIFSKEVLVKQKTVSYFLTTYIKPRLDGRQKTGGYHILGRETNIIKFLTQTVYCHLWSRIQCWRKRDRVIRAADFKSSSGFYVPFFLPPAGVVSRQTRVKNLSHVWKYSTGLPPAGQMRFSMLCLFKILLLAFVYIGPEEPHRGSGQLRK